VALITAGLGNHQTKVRVDHLILGVEVAPLDPLRQVDLLGGGQQMMGTGLAVKELE
jgi:hypothetical protein